MNHLKPDEKLSVLRQPDTHRKWYSLDDRRVCVICDKLITGRMIDVRKDRRGSYRVGCPTPGCSATPQAWFYHRKSQAPVASITQTDALMVALGWAA